METIALETVLREMRVDAWTARRTGICTKQYVLCGIQSVFLSTDSSLPSMYVNALGVCQVSLVAVDKVRALGALLAEAKGLKSVNIRVTVRFANTTSYINALEILKIGLVAPDGHQDDNKHRQFDLLSGGKF